jgi:hypothetical protein
MAWRIAHHALEGRTEHAFRFISERAGGRTDGLAARHTASGEQHPPAREIFDRPVADQLPKVRRETRARHAGFGSECRHCPAPRRVAVDRRDRGTDTLVGQRKQPADMFALIEMEAKRLDEDHVDQLLHDQETSRPGIDELPAHTRKSPVQGLAIGLTLKMDNGRQHAEQDVRLRPGELEMAANHRAAAPDRLRPGTASRAATGPSHLG